jgi:hypothetical protein
MSAKCPRFQPFQPSPSLHDGPKISSLFCLAGKLEDISYQFGWLCLDYKLLLLQILGAQHRLAINQKVHAEGTRSTLKVSFIVNAEHNSS